MSPLTTTSGLNRFYLRNHIRDRSGDQHVFLSFAGDMGKMRVTVTAYSLSDLTVKTFHTARFHS